MYLSERTIEYTRRFYAWERRGRGVDVWDASVHPEPPLAWPNFFARATTPSDNTRKTSALSRLFSKRKEKRKPVALPEPEEAEAEPLFWPQGLHEHALLLPKDAELHPDATLAFLASLQTLSAPLVYELIGQAEQVEQRISCQPEDTSVLRSAIGAAAPMARLEEVQQTVIDRWTDLPNEPSVVLEFGLGREFMLPLESSVLRPTLLASLVQALSTLGANELGLVQVIFAPTRQPWREAVADAVTSPSGDPFFADALEITRLAAEKISSPLLAATLRVAVFAGERGFDTLRTIAAGLGRLSGANELIPLGAHEKTDLEADILLRSSNRTGMILSLPELAQLVSLPTRPEETRALTRIAPGKPASERLFAGEGVEIGHNPSSRRLERVRLPIEDRLRHTHVLGATGTGKSTLLARMVLQDVEVGHGVALLDPHGDLVDEVLGRIPEERISDCIVFDPSNPETVVGWNILSANSEAERQMLASDLVASFRRLATSWGDQMTSVLTNAVLSFLGSERGGTLLDLRRFLTDKAFRDNYIPSIRDEYLASYWTTEFPLIAGRKPQGPILTRLDTLLRSKLVRDVVTTSEKHLDFRGMMDERRIFLARLSQGAIGRENAALLGSLLTSKFQQTALSRQDIPESERTPFFMYLDEVQEIATPSLADTLAGVRKYGVGVTASHQSMYQLKTGVPELERALLDNAHTRIYFRLGDDDSRRLADGFSSFKASDLTALRRGEAICRVGGSTGDFDLRTAVLPMVDEGVSKARRASITEKSNKQWGSTRTKTKVERTFEAPPPAEPQPPPTTQAVSAEPIHPARRVGRAEPKPDGRGGPEHQYLQSLIREWAQERGYKVDLEYELANGTRVDLLLTKADERHVVEVSVSTEVGHEINGVRRRLEAGIESVYVVSLKLGFLKSLAKRLDELLRPEERAKVQAVTPEDLLGQLSEEPLTKNTVAGYAVRTVSKSTRGKTMKDQREKLASIIAKSAKRLSN